jgi:hypothetical protein
VDQESRILTSFDLLSILHLLNPHIKAGKTVPGSMASSQLHIAQGPKQTPNSQLHRWGALQGIRRIPLPRSPKAVKRSPHLRASNIGPMQGSEMRTLPRAAQIPASNIYLFLLSLIYLSLVNYTSRLLTECYKMANRRLTSQMVLLIVLPTY